MLDQRTHDRSQGQQVLRNAVAATYSSFLGRELNPETEVLVTTGANEGLLDPETHDASEFDLTSIAGILSAIAALVNPGEEVLVFEPFFDQFVNNITFVGAVPRFVALSPPSSSPGKRCSAGDWTVDMEKLATARTDKTKMIILNSPHNPLGKVFTAAELAAIGHFCVKHNIIILSDEVYEHLSYTSFTRMASLSTEIAQLTITAGSAGKSFFVTGWRIGWMMAPETLLKHITRAHTAICFSTVSPFQPAIAHALTSKECLAFWKQSNQEMHDRMQRFVAIFDELGLSYYEPEAGFLVMVDMSNVQIPSDWSPPAHILHKPYDFHMTWFLATVVGVGAIPGSTFCTYPWFGGACKCAVRFAFAKTFKDIDLAIERLRSLKNYI